MGKYKSKKNEKRNRSSSTSSSSPDIKKHVRNEKRSEVVIEKKESKPETKFIGPTIPSFMRETLVSYNTCENVEAGDCKYPLSNCGSDSDVYGPALPPTLQTNPTNCIVKSTGNDDHGDYCNDDDDDCVVGPLPLSDPTSSSSTQIELDKRAEYLKRKFSSTKDDEDAEQKRETWMVELPEEKSVKFGLGPRKFRTHDVGDKKHRSLWTSKPGDKSTPEDATCPSDDFTAMAASRKDKKMEKLVQEHKDKRQKSLLEIHQEKMREKSKEETKPSRRPFSREIDLQVHKFDEAQKKSIIKKSQQLDSRFSQGESKFL